MSPQVRSAKASDASVFAALDEFFPIESFLDDYLTSGQEQIFGLIIAVAQAPPNTLILIDEPEISLHVDWQVDLIQRLFRVMNENLLIVTTHSPDLCVNQLQITNSLQRNQKLGVQR